MKVLFFMTVLFINTNLLAAQTQKINFTYFGNEGRNTIMLSCYYAQNAVDQILDQLDAKNIEVECRGGLDFGFYTPVNIRASFDLPENESTYEINSDYNSNCFFDTRFMDNLSQTTSRIEKVSGSRFCFNSDSRYQYQLKVTQ